MTRRIDRRSFVAWPFRGVSHRPLLDLVDESWLCNEVEVLSNSLDRIASRSLVSSKTFGRLLESEEHLLLREITRGVRIDDQFPGWTPYWDATSGAIAEVGHLADFPRNSFRSRMRDVRSCRGAVFELVIAAGYSRSSWNIQWTDTAASRAGEFLSRKGKDAVFVECKAKEGYTQRTNQMRSIQRQVSDGLSKVLKKHGLNVLVKFEMIEYIRNPNYRELITFTVKLARTGSHRTGLYRGAIRVEVLKLCDSGESIPRQLIADLAPRIDPRHEWGAVFHTQKTNRLSADLDRLGDSDNIYPFEHYTDPIVLRFSSSEDIDGRVRGIYNAINTARRQLPRGKKGFIYVDAGIDDYEAQEDIYSELSHVLDDWITNCGTRVKGFVVANAYPVSSRDHVRGWGIRTIGRVIQSAGDGLPVDFPLLGGLGIDDRENFLMGSWDDF